MVHACKTNTGWGGVGWVTVFPSIFFSQPDCRSGRLILRLVSTHSRRKRSPRGVCSRFRAAASSSTYLPRRAFPLPPVSAFVFVVGVLEQHQNHSFIVEPAAAAQTSIIHSRARRQQRQRKKNRKLHKRIRSRWCRRSRVVKLIVYNRTRVVYGISKRTAVFPPPTKPAVQLLGLTASV